MKIKKQQDIRDCGVNVIQALNAFFHGKFIDENEIKKNAKYGEKGISAKNLINLANLYGIKLTPYKVNYQDLRDSKIKKYLVTIIKSQNESHYVIIKIKKTL